MAEIQMPPCDHEPVPYTGPSREEVMATRRDFTNPGIFTFYSDPLLVVEGHMQWLFDETGRRYLDLFAGILAPHLADDEIGVVVGVILGKTLVLRRAQRVEVEEEKGVLQGLPYLELADNRRQVGIVHKDGRYHVFGYVFTENADLAVVIVVIIGIDAGALQPE